MKKFKLKQLLTMLLLLCFCQDAICVRVKLVNKLDEKKCGKDGIKYKISEKGTGTETKAIEIKFGEGAEFDFDPSTQDLWVAPASAHRWGGWHYSEIKINGKKKYVVEVKELYAYFFGPKYNIYSDPLDLGNGFEYLDAEASSSSEDSSGFDPKATIEESDLVEVEDYFDLTTEPTITVTGSDVASVYQQYSKEVDEESVLPLDVEESSVPVYLATYNDDFLEIRCGKRWRGLCSRISLCTYCSTIFWQCWIPPIYIVEFAPKNVNDLPNELLRAITTKYHNIDLSNGLHAGLTLLNVDVCMIGCAFGPIPVSGSNLKPSFNLIPFGFLLAGRQVEEFNDFVWIGLFQPQGISPWAVNPMATNTLADQNFSSATFFTENMLGCQLLDPNGAFASVYVVVLASDLRSILITHILIANSKKSADEISRIFNSKDSLKKLLETLSVYARTHTNIDQQALRDTVNSLITMSGRKCSNLN